MTNEEAKSIIEFFYHDILNTYKQRTDLQCALDLAIEALKRDHKVEERPKGEWIPVNDRLPEEREWYLAVFKESDTGFQLIPRVADYIGHGKNEWRLIDEDGLVKEYRDILECIAWMPLPKPYMRGDL